MITYPRNNTIKKLTKEFFMSLGFKIYRVSEDEQKGIDTKLTWLRQYEIKTILDIGANTGQFAHKINKIFPNANIYCFEPLEDCYQELVNNCREFNSFQAFNCAIGNETGEIEIHRSEYSPSSSLLPMADLHKESYPHTRNEIIEKVKIMRLDDVGNDLQINKPLLIKIDVQGFEDKVIAGGIELISQADILLLELSIEPLYKEQVLFNEIYRKVVDVGFKYQGNYSQLLNPKDGRILQVDSIFVKAK